MKKYFLIVALLLSGFQNYAQRGQLIAYVDMNYILENIPEYTQAQNTLEAKVTKWKSKLDKQAQAIEVLKTELATEKAILTEDLIEEKEEEIIIKQEELRRLESLYFGPNGDMFQVRKQLVKPIQDQVYNAIQSIVQRRKYDFVFEKSSDLILLYSNKKYDISDLVLATIDRTRLAEEKKANKEKKKAKPIVSSDLKPNAVQKKMIAKKEAAKELLEETNAKKKEAAEEKIAEKEAKKKAIADKRAELLKQRAEQRKILREKKEAQRKKKEAEKKKKIEEAKKKKEAQKKKQEEENNEKKGNN